MVRTSPVVSGWFGGVHPANEVADEEQQVGDGQRHQVMSGRGPPKTVRDGTDDDTERVAHEPGGYDYSHDVERAVAYRRLDPLHAGVGTG